MDEGIRLPAAAGTFYPAGAGRLVLTVDALLAGASLPRGERPWGIVVPHAGYRYSGPVAASAYAALRPWADRISRVVLIGPAHFVPLEGCAVTTALAWRTPLGDVPVDEELREAAVRAGCRLDERPHSPEHSLEVQLPFLQRLLGANLRILPIAAGRAPAGEVAGVLGAIERSADIVVASTDLSHYLDLDTARAADRRTADAVLARDPEAIGPEDACGMYALRGVLKHARLTGKRIDLLDLRTSGDTAGDPERVVGYGAFTVV
ncbi:MAG: AmmeMemoRadiSam system protein B [Actinobacteria bacterium]|nr:AmmeMemoRadiSam system protein B [Actinomycetota bacterium]